MDRKLLLLIPLWTLFVALSTITATKFSLENERSPQPAPLSHGVIIKEAKEFAALARGYLSQEPRDYPKAAYYFEKASKLNPQSGELALWLGCCYKSLNRPDDALSCYKKALDIDRDDAHAIFLLGLYYIEERRDAHSASLCLCRLRELPGQETGDLAAKLEEAISPLISKPSPRSSLWRCATWFPARPLPPKTVQCQFISAVNLEK